MLQGKHGKEARVVNARLDSCSRNVFRYPELAKRVDCSKVSDHFIFSVESVGANTPEELVSMAWDVLVEKCDKFIAELNSASTS